MQAALDDLWTYTGEMFAADAVEPQLIDAGIAADAAGAARRRGARRSTRVLAEATLAHARGRRGCRAATGAAAGRACTPSTSGTCSPRCSSCSAPIRARAGDGHAASSARSRHAAAAARRRDRCPLAVVWDALAGVPDPEIPAISIVELGIVRDVAWIGGPAARRRHADLFRLPGDRADRDADPRARSRRSACRDVELVTRLSPRVDHRLDDARGARRKLARVRHRAAAGDGGAAASTSPASARCAAPRSPCRVRAAARRARRCCRSSARPRARRTTAARPAASRSTTSSRTDGLAPIRRERDPPMSKFHPLRVARVERETRDAVAITFAVPPALAEQFRFAPGPAPDAARRHRRRGRAPLVLDLLAPCRTARCASRSSATRAACSRRGRTRRCKAGDTLDVMPPLGHFGVPLDAAQRAPLPRLRRRQRHHAAPVDRQDDARGRAASRVHARSTATARRARDVPRGARRAEGPLPRPLQPRPRALARGAGHRAAARPHRPREGATRCSRTGCRSPTSTPCSSAGPEGMMQAVVGRARRRAAFPTRRSRSSASRRASRSTRTSRRRRPRRGTPSARSR